MANTFALFRNPAIQSSYESLVQKLMHQIFVDEDAALNLQAFIDEWGIDFDPTQAISEANETELMAIRNMYYTRLVTDILVQSQVSDIGLTDEERKAEEAL